MGWFILDYSCTSTRSSVRTHTVPRNVGRTLCWGEGANSEQFLQVKSLRLHCLACTSVGILRWIEKKRDPRFCAMTEASQNGLCAPTPNTLLMAILTLSLCSQGTRWGPVLQVTQLISGGGRFNLGLSDLDFALSTPQWERERTL